MKRLFGTNGIRFVVDQNLNPNFILESAMAIGTFFKNQNVAMGMDTRSSGELVKSALVSGLTACGCEVLELGVVPSPCLQLAAKNNNIPGVMITASHNPPEFNGLKCMDNLGMELGQKDEKKIENIYWAKKFKLADWRDIKGIVRTDYKPKYIETVLSQVNSQQIRNSKFKVVVDCGNGSGSLTTPYMLERLGCEVVSLNSQPSGEPSRPYEPTIENVQGLVQLMKSAKADLGVAHDGDADRTIFVDENGEYVHGDRSLALIAKDSVSKTKGLVVTPVSSSQCIETVVVKAGGKIHYTKVGAPIVAREMYEKGAVFGGEENGGMIFPEHLCSRDGGMAVARVLQIMSNRKKKLSTLLKEIPYYYQFKSKLQCDDNLKQRALKKLIENLKKKGANMSTIDGVKLFDKNGWVLIRPSGTEPLFRIFAEGKTKKSAEELAKEGKKLLEECIRTGK